MKLIAVKSQRLRVISCDLPITPREEFDADNNIINLKNGLYDWKNDLLKEHSPDYLSINQKSIVYDKNAKPKLFGKFLSQVLYSRDIRTAIDAMAYTFHRDYDIEVIFILYTEWVQMEKQFLRVF